MNLYEMYIANGMEVGFWIKRRTWADLCARVTHVGELDHRAPCFGHPPVRADLYRFSTGELTQADAVITWAGSAKIWHLIPPPPNHVWGRSPKRRTVGCT